MGRTRNTKKKFTYYCPKTRKMFRGWYNWKRTLFRKHFQKGVIAFPSVLVHAWGKLNFNVFASRTFYYFGLSILFHISVALLDNMWTLPCQFVEKTLCFSVLRVRFLTMSVKVLFCLNTNTCFPFWNSKSLFVSSEICVYFVVHCTE